MAGEVREEEVQMQAELRPIVANLPMALNFCREMELRRFIFHCGRGNRGIGLTG